MRFLGGLLRGQKDDGVVVQKLLSDLGTPDGVSDPVWAACLESDGLEDMIEDELPREALKGPWAKHPNNVYALAGRCLESIEDALGKQGDAFDEQVEGAMVNAALILTRLLTATSPSAASAPSATGAKPGGSAGPASVAPSAAGGGSLVQRFWEPEGEGARPVGERMVDAAMRMLFLEGFSAPPPDNEGEAAEVANGIRPAVLWASGIGSEGDPEKADADTWGNRRLSLHFLAALLCGGAPAVEMQSNDAAALAMEAAEKDKLQKAAAVVPAVRHLLSGADAQALSYLCDPARQVPNRGELLYSLLNFSLGYDPHGYGLPYAGYIVGAQEEKMVTVSLQVLCLLLQDPTDLQVPLASGLVEWRPQEKRGTGCGLPAAGPHAFRALLAGVKSDDDTGFVASGVITLLGTLTEERSTYLPSSMRVPAFMPEVVLLVAHLVTHKGFVISVCKSGDAAALVEGVLHVASRVPDYMPEDCISLLTGLILLRLTAYREVCVALSEEFGGDVPDELNEFDGTGLDLVALASLKQVGDHLTMAADSEVHRLLVEVHLCATANISTFAEGLAVPTSFRLFALLERCVKSALAKRTRVAATAFLPLLLEMFQNVVQYQYGPNTNLVYGLVTRQTLLRDLAALAAELADAEGEPDSQQWWRGIATSLAPLIELLSYIVPVLESEVEKQDISNPDEVKALLPRSVLGLLPLPHAFVLRSLVHGALSHMVCERFVLVCLGNGPAGSLWEEGIDEDSGKPPPPKKDKTPSKRSAVKGGPTKGPTSPKVPTKRTPEKDSDKKSPDRRREAQKQKEQAAASKSSGAPPPPPAAAATGSLEEQLKAAAAAGVDVAALLQQLQANKQT